MRGTCGKLKHSLDTTTARGFINLSKPVIIDPFGRFPVLNMTKPEKLESYILNRIANSPLQVNKNATSESVESLNNPRSSSGTETAGREPNVEADS